MYNLEKLFKCNLFISLTKLKKRKPLVKFNRFISSLKSKYEFVSHEKRVYHL